MLPAGGLGPARTPFAGVVGITSMSESGSVSSWGGPLPRLWSRRALMTSCALFSVGDRGHYCMGLWALPFSCHCA